jgi:uncharacterized membrane protein YjgN (DUF898 family)
MTITTDAAPVRHPLRFEGSAGEYFKIWIVNLALTIATLGIFSAWAKVRNKRYFLGNTYIGAHSFDYHGSPKRILLGRFIALALLLGYSLSVNLGGPKSLFVWLPLFVVALPWLVRSSLRFNARNTSYRNVRFDFHGTYGGAFWAFALWPVFMVLSLGTLAPLAHRARDYYNINNHSFGGKDFHAEIEGWSIYKIYLLAILFFILGLILAAGVGVAMGSVGLLAAFKSGAHPPPAAVIPFIAVIVIVYLATILFVGTYLRAMTFNLAVRSTQLDGGFTLESDLSPWAMTAILVSNLVVTLLTLGLMYPWARVRQSRYIVEHLAITGPDDFDGFVSTAASQSGAIGEEVAGFFDIDIGL